MARIPVEQRREQLIEATATVLAEGGITAVSTRSITSEADAPLAILHYAFGSLEELLEATMRAQVEVELQAGLAAVSGDGEPVDVIGSALRAFLDFVRDNEGRERGLLELMLHAGRQTGLRELAPQMYARYHSAMAEAAVSVAQHGGWQWRVPVEQVARFGTVQADGLVLAWLATHDEDLLSELIRASAQALARLAGEATDRETADTEGRAGW